MATIVTVGRNYGKGPLKGKPMDDTLWNQFRSKVETLLFTLLKLEPYTKATGKGWYEAQIEDCAIWVVSDVKVRDLPSLTKGLKALALDYSQDSIALQLGETHFIKP